MSDIWRIGICLAENIFSTQQDITIYTRINYFLINAKLMLYAKNAKYQNIVFSYHSPLTCTLNIQNIQKPQLCWRLNPLLLTEKKLVRLSKNSDMPLLLTLMTIQRPPLLYSARTLKPFLDIVLFHLLLFLERRIIRPDFLK